MDLDKIVKKIRNSELSEEDVLVYGRILITEFSKEYHKNLMAIAKKRKGKNIFNYDRVHK